jgi:serine/threonine protein kinase
LVLALAHSARARDAGACLSEDEVLAIAEARMTVASEGRMHAHLDACPVCLELVAIALNPITQSRELAYPSLFVAPSFHRGEIVAGRYHIQRFIARGGMGEVYSVRDAARDRPLALKTITPTRGDSPAAVVQLLKEASLARSILHPHVCRVYDSDAHHSPSMLGLDLPLFTMDLIEGPSLGQQLLAGPLDVALATRLMAQILLGLGAIHTAGVLHLDIKSENVLLRPTASGVDAVITDFGVATEMTQAFAPGKKLLVGSLGYMAPELLSGHAAGVRADLFSAGVVFFEMLTGQRPFCIRPSQGSSRLGYQFLIAPARPSELVRDVPRHLDDFVLRCLSPDPDQRYSDADSALEALRRISSPSASSRPA